MRYHVLAVDYDGTIALHGKVPREVVETLKKVKASSRKLLLVTGRELDELKEIFYLQKAVRISTRSSLAPSPAH